MAHFKFNSPEHWADLRSKIRVGAAIQALRRDRRKAYRRFDRDRDESPLKTRSRAPSSVTRHKAGRCRECRCVRDLHLSVCKECVELGSPLSGNLANGTTPAYLVRLMDGMRMLGRRERLA